MSHDRRDQSAWSGIAGGWYQGEGARGTTCWSAWVLLPARNEKDLREVPEAARAALQFVFLETVDDAIRHLLGQRGASRAGSEFKLV